MAGHHCAVNSVSDYRFRGHKFESQLGHITFTDIHFEIVPMVILRLNGS